MYLCLTGKWWCWKLLLEIRDLAVEVDNKEILSDIDLYIDEGETHVLLGPNGSGKSTLFMSILGFPKYKITRGEIIFKEEDITHLNTTERVKMGIGVSFQNPPAIRGVKLKDLLKIEHHEDIKEELSPELTEEAGKLKFDERFLERDVNLGFSGGEVKRSEILQLLAQKPDFIMFDEPDSGVDIENVELLAEEINTLLDKNKKPGLRNNSGLLITHLGYILNFVTADTAHVLMDGKIACSGNPAEILEDVRKEGFKGCVECCKLIH
jgi:Fe-S cluster assembly ATP-binding protein